MAVQWSSIEVSGAATPSVRRLSVRAVYVSQCFNLFLTFDCMLQLLTSSAKG